MLSKYLEKVFYANGGRKIYIRDIKVRTTKTLKRRDLLEFKILNSSFIGSNIISIYPINIFENHMINLIGFSLIVP